MQHAQYITMAEDPTSAQNMLHATLAQGASLVHQLRTTADPVRRSHILNELEVVAKQSWLLMALADGRDAPSEEELDSNWTAFLEAQMSQENDHDHPYTQAGEGQSFTQGESDSTGFSVDETMVILQDKAIAAMEAYHRANGPKKQILKGKARKLYGQFMVATYIANGGQVAPEEYDVLVEHAGAGEDFDQILSEYAPHNGPHY